MMKKILTIVSKEWMEIFTNKIVIFTVAFLPLIMAVIPLTVLYSTRSSESALLTGNNFEQAQNSHSIEECSSTQSDKECFQVFLVNQFILLFMVIPIAIPGTIAAYSIVGEKSTHSLEPLLATPISTIELLVGKCLAAVVPAIISTDVAFAIFTLGVSILEKSNNLVQFILNPTSLIAILFVGPSLAILATTFALMVSSRVNDPRVAEQISMIVIIPVLGAFFGQLSGLFVVDFRITCVFLLVMLVVDSFMFFLASQLFDRESILTRWR